MDAPFRRAGRALFSVAALALALCALPSCGSSIEECIADLDSEDFEDRLDAAVMAGEKGARLAAVERTGQTVSTLNRLRGALGDKLAKDDHPLVRAACARSLLQVKAPLAAELFERALDDVDPLVRAEAAAGLGAVGRAEAAPRLAAMLASDKDPGVRKECARQLGCLMAAGQVDALIAALSDRNQAVRVNAEKALNSITCRDLGPSPADWRKWAADYRKRTGADGAR